MPAPHRVLADTLRTPQRCQRAHDLMGGKLGSPVGSVRVPRPSPSVAPREHSLGGAEGRQQHWSRCASFYLGLLVMKQGVGP